MINKYTLVFIGTVYITNAMVMWFAPAWWYETIPGIIALGPFNMHFLRDIALIYLVSGLGLVVGSRGNWKVALFAGLWPALHAVFHGTMFFQRGAPMDDVAAVNLFLIQLPAWLSIWAAFNLRHLKNAD